MRPLTAAALFFATAALSCTGPDPRITAIAALTGNPTAGQMIYVTAQSAATPSCASCHQADGNGNAAYPNLHGPARTQSVQSLATWVVNGSGASGMPAFGGVLTDQQIADVVAYVRMAFGN